MELFAALNVATAGGADESAPTEATEARTNSSPSNPPSNSSGLCVSSFSSVVLPAHENCSSSDAQGVVTTAAEGSADQAVKPPAKRQRSDCAFAEGSRTETESSTTGEIAIPSAVSSGDVSGLRYPKQDHHQRQAEQEQPVLLGGDTAFPNEGKEENVSSVSAEPEGDASSSVSTGVAAKDTTHSDGEQRGGISLGVFFGTGGEEDIDLDSLFTAQHVRSPSRDPPRRPSQAGGEAAVCLGESSASAPLAGSEEGDASTADSAAAAVATRAAAATEPTTPSTVAVEACAMATPPDGSQAGPHTTLSEGSAGGVVKGESSADAASLTAAANEADCEGLPVANSDPAAVDAPSLAIASGACNDSSRANVISNGSSTAANAPSSSKSSSGADTVAVDNSATGPNTSSSSTSVLGRVEESVEDANEVIDLSNVEVVDSDDGSDVPVVDVETEAVCLDSLPTSSEGSSAGLQSGEPQQPPPGSPTAVVLDSDDDDVVELRCRQGVPFSVQQYNNYVARHPMYPHSMAAGFTGMPMNAHFRHRPLQEEMTQLREDDEASSNPALPRCPICLKRYRQQQQESGTRSQQKSDANDGIQSHTAEESDNPTSESPQNLSTNTSTGHENWDQPPPPLPPQNSAESDKDHVVALKCGHVFCKGCIQVALRTRRQCPVCRVVLRGNRPYQRIFL